MAEKANKNHGVDGMISAAKINNPGGKKMPWCPKCRNEYVEGMEVCVDCGSPLVESLEETKSNPLIFGDKEQMEKLENSLHIIS